ncbi:hypothetical protein [Natrinema sp. DC36]|nr:hypothetical protein [Natrinema sp. DC36]
MISDRITVSIFVKTYTFPRLRKIVAVATVEGSTDPFVLSKTVGEGR